MLGINLLGHWIEGLDYEYQISSDCSRHQSARSSCNKCIESCPEEAISLIDGKPVIENKDCIECGLCVASCPVQAVEGFLPKRTVADNCLIIDENNPPTIKELLVYYKKGITTIICEYDTMDSEWEIAIKNTNQALEELGESPFEVHFKQVEPKQSKKISRRELFFIWERTLKEIGNDMTPAKWRFNHESLDLSKYYPDHQFVTISLDTDKCSLCKACQFLCKKDCLQVGDTHFSISNTECTNCSLCQDICPEGAISLTSMISTGLTEKHLLYNNYCTSCERPFQTFHEEDEHCFVCMKIKEHSFI